MDNSELDLASLTADIVSAYVAHNAIGGEKLPDFIGSVYAALSKAATRSRAAESRTEALHINQEIRDAGLHRLFGRRSAFQIPQETPAKSARPVSRGIQGKVGTPARLSHGCSGLYYNAFESGQKHGAGSAQRDRASRSTCGSYLSPTSRETGEEQTAPKGSQRVAEIAA